MIFRKVFYGEGDHEPGKEPGDIIIQMEEKEHAVFQRHGQRSSSSTSLQGAGNLPKTRMLSDSNPSHYQLSFCLKRSFQAVTLRWSWTSMCTRACVGWRGRWRHWTTETSPSAQGLGRWAKNALALPYQEICFLLFQVIKQADIKMIAGEGMPTHKDPFNKGKLIVLFNITFPEKLDPSVAKKLSALLPKPKLPPVPAGAEDVHLEVFDGRQRLHKNFLHPILRLDYISLSPTQPNLSFWVLELVFSFVSLWAWAQGWNDFHLRLISILSRREAAHKCCR